MSVREDQINQAIKFLTDQRTQNASAADKDAFLRHKGLTDAEISAAMQRVATPLLSMPFPVPQHMNMEEPILWAAIKSIFSAVGAMAIGVIGYHAYLDSSSQLNVPDTAITGKDDNGVVANNTIDSGAEERILEVIRQMKAEQALRHFELLQRIRELTDTVNRSGLEKSLRKPGGSIVLDSTIPDPGAITEVEAQGAAPVSDSTNANFDVQSHVENAIADGIDTTLLLVLSNLDKNRKLNKQNTRFSRLAGSLILDYCGFVEGSQFFELSDSANAFCNTRAIEIVQEIKKQKAAKESKQSDIPLTKPDEPAVPKSDAVLPPWIANTTSTPNLEPSEKIVDSSDP